MLYGEKTAKVLKVLRKEKELYRDYLSVEALIAGEELVKATEGLWDDVLEKIAGLVQKEIPEEFPHVFVWWYSVLMGMRKDANVFRKFVENVRKRQEAFSPNTRYFLFYQLKSYWFRFQILDSLEVKEDLWKFFVETMESFTQRLHCPLEPIPEEERNPELALVITEQFVEVQHGPTKTALDRCKALMTGLGKNVVLMNTMEVNSTLGEIPFLSAMKGYHLKEMRNEKQKEWKGVQVPYFQCSEEMPDMETLDTMLSEIRRMAPSLVIAIGGSGALVNLVNRMIPVLTIGLCPSELEFTTTKYQALGRPLAEEDRELLRRMYYGEDSVIESIFTSDLKQQTEHITRAEIGLPEDGFLMAVVGTRLDVEVTDAFLKMVESALQDGMYLVFIGVFDAFSSVFERHPRLRKQAILLGYCQDILSRIELCDLYLNPIRKGGGTSCVEALFKGVPVVSVDYGDVSINVGKDFCVKDYPEMAEKIEKYYCDSDFYQEMSGKARRRSEILLNTEKEFLRIIEEMRRREEKEKENGQLSGNSRTH